MTGGVGIAIAASSGASQRLLVSYYLDSNSARAHSAWRHQYRKVGLWQSFQNRVGLARWHVPWAFTGINPQNVPQLKVNERFVLKSTNYCEGKLLSGRRLAN